MTRPQTALLGASAAVIAVLAFFAGRALHPETADSYVFDSGAAPYTSSNSPAGFSQGGFSGFGEVPAFDGRTVIGGIIDSVSAEAIQLDTRAGKQVLRTIGQSPPIFRLEAADTGRLRPGSTVVARQATSGGETVAVLVLDAP